MAAIFHSAPILGISLWALLRPSLTPVRNLMVRGISPSALFIPISIFPNFPAASSTVSEESFQYSISRRTQQRAIRAEPLPVRKTRSIGQPQFKSIKSMPPLHSLAINSAVGTSVAGLLPATCTPNIVSDGCRLTKDHSSLGPDRKDVARPTMCNMSFPSKGSIGRRRALTFSARNVSTQGDTKTSVGLENEIR